MADATITAKRLAQACNTDPKTLRRFLREQFRANGEDTPGQGGRYGFTKAEARTLGNAFKKWHAPKIKAAETEADEVEEVDGEEVEEVELETDEVEDVDLDEVDEAVEG